MMVEHPWTTIGASSGVTARLSPCWVACRSADRKAGLRSFYALICYCLVAEMRLIAMEALRSPATSKLKEVIDSTGNWSLRLDPQVSSKESNLDTHYAALSLSLTFLLDQYPSLVPKSFKCHRQSSYRQYFRNHPRSASVSTFARLVFDFR